VPRRAELAVGERQVHAGRIAVQVGGEQPAVRDVDVLPAGDLRQVTQGVQDEQGGGGPVRRRRGRDPVGAPEPRPEAGGLHPGEQRQGDVVHGRVRRQLPAARAPPGRVDPQLRQRARHGRGRLQRRLPVLPRRGARPERAHRRRRRGPRRERRVRRRPRQLRAVRAGHLHQRAARRHAGLPVVPCPATINCCIVLAWCNPSGETVRFFYNLLYLTKRRKKEGKLFTNNTIESEFLRTPLLLFFLSIERCCFMFRPT
jgi:hypothetical protein